MCAPNCLLNLRQKRQKFERKTEKEDKKKYSYYDDKDILATSDRALFPSRGALYRAVRAIVVRGRCEKNER